MIQAECINILFALVAVTSSGNILPMFLEKFRHSIFHHIMNSHRQGLLSLSSVLNEKIITRIV